MPALTRTCLLLLSVLIAVEAVADDAQIEELVVHSAGDATAPPGAHLRYEALPSPPDGLADMTPLMPGVALSGQGGLLQTFSVRGLGGERVRSLLLGVPVRALRRAGSSLSFADPRLFSVTSTVAASAVEQGTGSTGGVVALEPRIDRDTWLEVGAQSDGPGYTVAGGAAAGLLRAGLSIRQQDEPETPGGETLNTDFEQMSALVNLNHRRHGFTVLASRARDVGKSNVDHPSRSTRYPEIGHLFANYAWQGERLDVAAWLHEQTLDTQVIEADTVTDARVESTDYGLRLHSEGGRDLRWQVGADLFGRSGFDQRERRRTEEAVTERVTVADGSELETGLWGRVTRDLGDVSVSLGTRYVHQSSDAEDAPSASASRWVWDVSGAWALGERLSVSARVATALTLPTISQRFFSGVTPRGRILGNADLREETAESYELRGSWVGRVIDLHVNIWQVRAEDLIEKQRLTGSLETFDNVTEATVEGVSTALEWRITPHTTGGVIYSRIRGEDDQDLPLADIPNDELTLRLTHESDTWRASLLLQHVRASHEVAPGNLERDAYTRLDASLSRTLADGWRVTLYGRNLNDEAYFPTVDDKAAQAPGRAFGVTVGKSF